MSQPLRCPFVQNKPSWAHIGTSPLSRFRSTRYARRVYESRRARSPPPSQSTIQQLCAKRSHPSAHRVDVFNLNRELMPGPCVRAGHMGRLDELICRETASRLMILLPKLKTDESSFSKAVGS